MQRFTSQSQRVGKMGEELAVYVLEKLNYAIIGRNYTKRVGEIDIIAMKGSQIFFFEVKRSRNSHYNPLDNISNKKIHSLRKVVSLYLIEHYLPPTTNYSIGAIAIMNKQGRIHVEIIESI